MTLANLIEKTKRILSSPYFFRWIVAIFLLQAFFSVFMISSSTPTDGVGGRYVERNENGVVPDGHRHLGAIYYYAERPIAAGPVITDMSDQDLWMGDLERFPSYLYYYALSFPVKAAMAMNFTDTEVVWLVRLIGVGLGLAALVVFRKIVMMVSKSVVAQNLSTLALALTGSFVWLSAAENYDIPALLLWFAFVYAAVELFTKNHAKYIYWMALWFFLLSITKYTYGPFAILVCIAAIWLYVRNQQASNISDLLRGAIAEVLEWLSSMKRWVLMAGAISLIFAGVLFSERIVGNIIAYRTLNPDCATIHSQESCMNFGVYARNYRQSTELEKGTAPVINYTPVSYLKLWIERYYDSMYVYMGHIYIPRYSMLIELTGIASLVLGILLAIVAVHNRSNILRTQQEWFLAGVVAMLVVVQFAYNVDTILQYGGQLYAHQGRYLLSAVGFAYLLYFLMVQHTLVDTKRTVRYGFIVAGLIVALFALLTTSAVPSFLIHAISSGWYSPLAQQILPGWLVNHFVFW